MRISYSIWQAFCKWAFALSISRASYSAFFAAALPLLALRTAFDDFLVVFKAAAVRRLADVLALADFFALRL